MSSAAWQPTTFRRYIRTIGTSSRPALIVTDVGNAYLKAPNNPEGPHVPACEWLGTKLASRFGLPTFDAAILWLTEEDEVPLNGETARVGPTFVTREEAGGPMGQSGSLERVVNTDIIPQLIVFDTWVRNCDRCGPGYGKDGGDRINLDNVFLSTEGVAPGNFRLTAIDHGHIFTCGKPLTPKSLDAIAAVKDKRIYGLLPGFRPFVSAKRIETELDRLGQMTTADWKDLLLELPAEWEITEELREALSRFLQTRAAFLINALPRIAHEVLHPGELFFPSNGG